TQGQTAPPRRYGRGGDEDGPNYRPERHDRLYLDLPGGLRNTDRNYGAQRQTDAPAQGIFYVVGRALQ
ncbi:MAG TPA: hypothetical protein VN709_06845, partial [Terriglobales bacterium]|nr:hypothetical protein [Terriglobales bacterium]